MPSARPPARQQNTPSLLSGIGTAEMPAQGQVQYVYPFPWLTVASACLFKFPDPEVPQVTMTITDLIANRLRQHIFSRRIFRVQNESPAWIRKLFAVEYLEFEEEVEIDFKSQNMLISSRNISFSSWMECREKSSYRPCPADPDNSTCFTQDVEIEGKKYYVNSHVERWILKQFISEAFRSHDRMLHRICSGQLADRTAQVLSVLSAS